MGVSNKYYKHFLLYESVIALAIIVLLILVTGLDMASLESFIHERGDILFPLITSISFVLLGFILTSMTIILSLMRISDSRLQLLRGKPQYLQIFHIYLFTIISLTTTGIISSLLIIFNSGSASWLVYILIWLILISGFSFYRCIWVLYYIIKISNIKM